MATLSTTLIAEINSDTVVDTDYDMEADSAFDDSGTAAPAPTAETPWYKTTGAIVGFVILGLLIIGGLFMAMSGGGSTAASQPVAATYRAVGGAIRKWRR